MSSQVNQLQQAIQHFHGEYTPTLRTLEKLLDEAGISHYSSGCGNKRITYDIFPASYYLRALIDLVSLDRKYKSKSDTGLKDFCMRSEYNPAHQFLAYLQRWTGFAEDVMQQEGDSARGIAAAQAKLLMNELMIRLSHRQEGKSIRLGAKLSAIVAPMDFYELMRRIGITLQENGHQNRDTVAVTAKQRQDLNYKKALAAANERLKELSFLKAAA